MLLNHIGVINGTEDEAVRFYRDFMGMELAKRTVVSSELSLQIFSLDRALPMLVFERTGMKVEVFICPDCRQPSPDIRHAGFFVDDLAATLAKAHQAGIDVVTGKTAEKTVYFVRDFSGNLIEIKQR